MRPCTGRLTCAANAGAGSGSISGSSRMSNTRSTEASALCSVLMVMDICVSGSDAWLMYWKNAWKMPMVICPAISMPQPITAMATCDRRPMNRMAGPVALVRKSARRLESASFCARSWISSELWCSRLNARMTTRPL